MEWLGELIREPPYGSERFMPDQRNRRKPYTLNHWVVGSVPTAVRASRAKSSLRFGPDFEARSQPLETQNSAIMRIQREDTAIVFIDPQNEVLSKKGIAWPLLRESLQENNTIENMERLFKAAKAHEFEVFHLSSLFLSHR